MHINTCSSFIHFHTGCSQIKYEKIYRGIFLRTSIEYKKRKTHCYSYADIHFNIYAYVHIYVCEEDQFNTIQGHACHCND